MSCRDCRTCTSPALSRMLLKVGMGCLHFCTVGLSFVAKRAFLRHCPHCKDLLTRHERRSDGSFRD